ncbi:uncharacterized protein CTHT_0020290 [Thermochaetoides thermophila DSM 1495]|uniref:Ysc84 actin-binding domain-containing protein n=1 Tax=Chaetomium thermophilum (strain DSM 1495 / CBS 144.50 / IMI 039719) TaxID=759272 RepID=G0S3A4_CHATD|nr:hypothetical protein CTHT_0020290 [Thermochaetoides thermophila DSM 1495]EGS22487.1 hypothetical protein CTHT_0020290 [Thermochaetoides thermophila DSM 1495]
MAFDEKKPAEPAAQPSTLPPPPPGPPPVYAEPPKHSNETPLPDYDIPQYNPANPQFAPPPNDNDDIYDATPTEEHPPSKFSRFFGRHHHSHGHEGEEEHGKKGKAKLTALGEAFASKVAGPVNAFANKFGAEGFLPESLDKECEKAARILRSFCKDGIYGDNAPSTVPPSPPTSGAASPGKGKKPKVLLTIPSKVIARAQGLAIFTAVRVGFQATGSSGSGILLARLPDGSWSPPSGIQVASIGAGFVAGVDIYDCVVVINTREALEAFTKTRLSLGSDLAVTAGPVGAGGAIDFGLKAGEGKGKGKEPSSPEPTAPTACPRARTKRRSTALREAINKPVYSYVKSRGLYAGIKIRRNRHHRAGERQREVLWPAHPGRRHPRGAPRPMTPVAGAVAPPPPAEGQTQPAAPQPPTEQLQNLNVGTGSTSSAAAGPSSAAPPPPPGVPDDEHLTPAAKAKAAEAAAEAEAARLAELRELEELRREGFDPSVPPPGYGYRLGRPRGATDLPPPPAYEPPPYEPFPSANGSSGPGPTQGSGPKA